MKRKFVLAVLLASITSCQSLAQSDYFVPQQSLKPTLDLTLNPRALRERKTYKQRRYVRFKKPIPGELTVIPVGCVYDLQEKRPACIGETVAQLKQRMATTTRLINGPDDNRAATAELLFVMQKLQEVISDNFEAAPHSVDPLRADISDVFQTLGHVQNGQYQGSAMNTLGTVALHEIQDIATNAVFTVDDLLMMILSGEKPGRRDFETVANSLTRSDGAGGLRSVDILMSLKAYFRARAARGEIAANEPFWLWLQSTSINYGFSAAYGDRGFEIAKATSLSLSTSFPVSEEWPEMKWKIDLRCGSWDDFRSCADKSLLIGLTTPLPLK